MIAGFSFAFNLYMQLQNSQLRLCYYLTCNYNVVKQSFLVSYNRFNNHDNIFELRIELRRCLWLVEFSLLFHYSNLKKQIRLQKISMVVISCHILLCCCRRKLKERLQIPSKLSIGYQLHDDSMAKTGSVTRNKYSLWCAAAAAFRKFVMHTVFGIHLSVHLKLYIYGLYC